MRLRKLNEGATGDFGQQFSQDWHVTTTNAFPTEGAKVGLLVNSTKDGAYEAGTGG